ncbi:signal peptidase II [Microbacterium sp. zg.Y1090]|uniref:signal peptidase II n=1 Tax=Microbacterium TaxID=33882 RepID=UPI00214ADC2E|nr:MULTISPECIES: signal peptidase II [unclassified Microbacterium]MCR2811444.1 signal peptidase II [Microbacterium sp. zg.Y1084]MCR2819138.1 signal peptidase II [Microbacterium sp. zg.Y1090]MDL5487863.1 signal peptidase II [Microbacterium sp. zg-Y1211]WIM27440.1 signal peptidase II [Microbacterium sp. zg-Y1090]
MTARAPLRTAAAGTITAILAALVLAADQFTKYLAIENLPYQEAVPVLGDFFQLYLTRNPGAAFSLGEGVTWIFTIVLAAAAVTIVVLTLRSVRSRLWAVVLGLLLGGILGNLTDRLLREPGFLVGHVVDFIHTPWMWLGLPSAIYNVADVFIVTMMITVALLVLVGVRFDGTREAHHRHATASDDASDSGDAAAPSDEAAKA